MFITLLVDYKNIRLWYILCNKYYKIIIIDFRSLQCIIFNLGKYNWISNLTTTNESKYSFMIAIHYIELTVIYSITYEYASNISYYIWAKPSFCPLLCHALIKLLLALMYFKGWDSKQTTYQQQQNNITHVLLLWN